MKREQLDKEVAYAIDGNRHKSVRLVTMQRVMSVMDEKTAALKKIHRLCNQLLLSDDCDDISGIKELRHIAGKYYPPLEPIAGPVVGQ